MTVTDFVSSNSHCTINNVPLEQAIRILTDVLPPVRSCNALRAAHQGSARDPIHLRFKNGVYVNWLNGGPGYFRGQLGVEEVIDFAELDAEDDEIDVSFDILADIL